MARAAGVILALALATAAAPGAASGQGCGVAAGTGVAAAAGAAAYRAGGGPPGPTWGGDASVRAGSGGAPGGLELRAGYRRMSLGEGRPDPHTIRVLGTVPVRFPIDWVSVCPVLHGGVSLLPLGDERYDVWAGGLGVRLAATALPLGAARAVPFAEVRGLAARSMGTVHGLEAGATGLALGLATGVRVTAGALVAGATAAVDGFDRGLGATPYPWWAGEVAVGLRF